MATRILFLDDDKERHRRFMMNRIGLAISQAWTCDEACRMLSETVFDEAHLDHDLSELAAMGTPAAHERTGTHVAEHIAAMPPDRRPRRVVIHSFNDAGRRRMAGILRDAGVPVIVQPFRG